MTFIKKIRNIKFSLKFKILLGICFLLVLFTAFTLGYSSRLFIEDKTSYIFEAGLKKAENISDQINFKLNELSMRAELNSVLLNNETIKFEDLTNIQSEIIAMGVIKINNRSPSIENKYFNEKNISRISLSRGIKSDDFIKEVISKAIDPSILLRPKAWFFSPKPNLKYLIHISSMPKNEFNENNEKFIFLISDFSQLFEVFQKDRTFTNRIISLDNPKDHLENLEWISKIDYSKSKKGVFETKIKHQPVLLSYVFVDDKILVLSTITKSDAFSMTRFLILKTIIFTALMLGVAIVAGIYFSLSITAPIVKLTENARKIAKGDFTSIVNINTSDEVRILGDTFNLMSYEIQILLKNKEELIAKLEDYSRDLEKKVKKRTSELKSANVFMSSMVNSLDQGLLVFDTELKCLPLFTKACVPIFGISPLYKTIPEILSITDEMDVKNLRQWATLAFKEMIPFESIVNLGPRQKITGGSYLDSDYKYVQIDYYPMRNDDTTIKNIVMIATDKTNEIQAIEKAKEKEVYVAMILMILNNKTQFESFINEVDEIFSQFKNAYSVENKSVEFDLCMMLFHTLYGGFGIYSITKLQHIAREFESEISIIKDSNPDLLEYIHLLEGHIEYLKQEFFNFRIELDLLVGTNFANNQSFTEISQDKILEFKEIVAKVDNVELQNYYSENFVKKPIINYFKGYVDFCRSTAIKINKDFHGLTFQNSELKINAGPLLEFFNVLIHLFRNCLDHGIEESHVRQLNGKDLEGHIDVAFDIVKTSTGDLLSIIIQDDGAGIDPEVIRTRYQKLNPDADISHLSDRDIIYKIFDPFFSTRDEVSALSGRGVGMSAIKEVLERLNGQIEIESHLGKGTAFSFIIPLKNLF